MRAEITALAERAFMPDDALAFPMDDAAIAQIVREALAEDRVTEDITSIATVPVDRSARAELVARRPGVICGGALAVETFRQCDPTLTIRVDVPDGRAVERGAVVLRVTGSARAILAGERVALNFMQRLSGIATLTAQYVHAVRCGGGLNHRYDLASAVLIKDNHLAALGGNVQLAVERARALAPAGMPIEVECDELEQVADAARAGADIILLDNMGLHDMREAVRMVDGRAVTEASGGVNLQTVCGIAETGVDWISVGALTHSAPSLDLALDFET